MNTSGYSKKLDGERLGKQLAHVKEFMLTASKYDAWHTLRTIHLLIGYPEASISARLRDLRRMGYQVDKRRRGEASRGCWEYRVSKAVLTQQRLAFIPASATGDRA
jgi:hypothetical protein